MLIQAQEEKDQEQIDNKEAKKTNVVNGQKSNVI